ncbi:hypothetical protein HanRHA438_Chr06g0267841 [Helianthus annuus]|nr:hypothetical protein HanIR_Chr06g0278391 [Helianthus annuus]KAJ0911859.1 hypothetical protein HanRHA438_Chr06g0267841 [Helianthus annuus]
MFFKIITGTTGLLTALIPARMGSGVVTHVLLKKRFSKGNTPKVEPSSLC